MTSGGSRSGRAPLATLLPTKLFAPRRRPTAVPRPRLVSAIQENLWRPLTVICAPAGFGKTTLVSQWLAETDRPVAWLSLDAEDNEPSRFLSYLLAAVQRVRPELVAELEGGMLPAGAVALEPLLADLLVVPLAEEPDPFVLVLDDFHVLHDRAMIRAIDWLVDNLPPCLHLLLTTRSQPELSLARRRTRDQVTEIDAADLAFSTGETGELLNERCHLQLESGVVAALQERTEGWPAGVHLLSIAARRGGSLADVLDALAESGDAANFLIREVVDRLEPRLRTFLLRASLLDQMSAPLAAAATGDEEAAQHLNAAYRMGLFLIALDHKRQWFRFHHLFGKTLRRLLAEEARGSETAIWRRAAEWWLAQPEARTAASYAVRAGATDIMARIVEAHGRDLLLVSDRLTLERWIAAVPPAADQAHPMVAVCRGWLAVLPVRSTPRVEQALAAVAAGRAGRAGGTPVDTEIDDNLVAIEAIATRPVGDLPACAEHARRTLERLSTPVSRSVVGLQLGILRVMIGQMGDALEPLARAEADARAGRNDYGATAAVGYRAWALRVLGRLDEARAICERAYRHCEAEGTAMLGMASHLHLELAHQHWERWELPQALAELEKAIPRARLLNDPFLLAANLALLTRVREGAGEQDLADDALRELVGVVARNPHPVLEGWAAAARGLLETGRGIPSMGLPAPVHGYTALFHDLALAGVRSLALLGDSAEALATATELGRRAAESGWAICALDWQVEVAVCTAAGRREEAQAALERAVELGERLTCRRVFNERSAALAGLGAAVVTVPTPVVRAHVDGDNNAPPLREPISPREREVLQLAVDGLSNPEIARALFVSPGTVKTHIHRILQKLDARNRLQAVQKARALGVLR